MGFNYQGRRVMMKGLNKNFPVTVASTGTPMQAGGIYTIASTVSSTGAGIKNYTLAAPSARQVGQDVEIHCIKATTVTAPRVSITSASLFSTVSSTAVTKDAIRFPRADQSIVLRAWSTAKWRVMSVSASSPTITTS